MNPEIYKQILSSLLNFTQQFHDNINGDFLTLKRTIAGHINNLNKQQEPEENEIKADIQKPE